MKEPKLNSLEHLVILYKLSVSDVVSIYSRLYFLSLRNKLKTNSWILQEVVSKTRKRVTTVSFLEEQGFIRIQKHGCYTTRNYVLTTKGKNLLKSFDSHAPTRFIYTRNQKKYNRPLKEKSALTKLTKKIMEKKELAQSIAKNLQQISYQEQERCQNWSENDKKYAYQTNFIKGFRIFSKFACQNSYLRERSLPKNQEIDIVDAHPRLLFDVLPQIINREHFKDFVNKYRRLAAVSFQNSLDIKKVNLREDRKDFTSTRNLHQIMDRVLEETILEENEAPAYTEMLNFKNSFTGTKKQYISSLNSKYYSQFYNSPAEGFVTNMHQKYGRSSVYFLATLVEFYIMRYILEKEIRDAKLGYIFEVVHDGFHVMPNDVDAFEVLVEDICEEYGLPQNLFINKTKKKKAEAAEKRRLKKLDRFEDQAILESLRTLN